MLDILEMQQWIARDRNEYVQFVLRLLSEPHLHEAIRMQLAERAARLFDACEVNRVFGKQLLRLAGATGAPG